MTKEYKILLNILIFTAIAGGIVVTYVIQKNIENDKRR